MSQFIFEKLMCKKNYLLLFLLLLTKCSFISTGSPSYCKSDETAIVVIASQHKLYLCENSNLVTTYGVRLASNGIGKKRANDKKLPLGKYSLGMPRKSDQFGIFIPVGYPTPAQINQGYSGGSIGVHGPIRWARFLGGLVNWFDTTRGCIGLATDDEMKEVSNWVVKKNVSSIRIEP